MYRMYWQLCPPQLDFIWQEHCIELFFPLLMCSSVWVFTTAYVMPKKFEPYKKSMTRLHPNLTPF